MIPARGLRPLQLGLTGGLVTYMVVRALSWLSDWPHVWDLLTNADHAIYLEQARRVLAGGPLYPAFELAGPFVPVQLPEVYPPPTVYGLFVPMSLLPMPLWWLIPLGITTAVVVWHRPRGWTLIAVLALLALPGTWIAIAAGNPSLWVVAGVALATIRPAFAALALGKPTLWPLAFIGIRSRVWWVAIAIYVVLAVVMLPAWADYATVLSNYRGGVLIPPEVGLVAVPLVAAYSGTRRRPRSRPVDSVPGGVDGRETHPPETSTLTGEFEAHLGR